MGNKIRRVIKIVSLLIGILAILPFLVEHKFFYAADDFQSRIAVMPFSFGLLMISFGGFFCFLLRRWARVILLLGALLVISFFLLSIPLLGFCYYVKEFSIIESLFYAFVTSYFLTLPYITLGFFICGVGVMFLLPLLVSIFILFFYTTRSKIKKEFK